MQYVMYLLNCIDCTRGLSLSDQDKNHTTAPGYMYASAAQNFLLSVSLGSQPRNYCGEVSVY